MKLYQSLVRPVLFQFDPENVHNFALSAMAWAAKLPWLQSGAQGAFAVQDSRLEVEVWGRRFKNPFGLAAGFDKDARAVEFLSALGFGHIEIGTVTYSDQPGNPRPRILRFPESGALINRMGFPSAGAAATSERLRKLPPRPNGCLLGINVGKTKSVPLDQAKEDYTASIRAFQNLGDYFVINVSSPNTPELRRLQEPERLSALLGAIREVNVCGHPLLVKLSPDLTEEQLEEVLGCCLEQKVSGVIATNTTLGREGLPRGAGEAGGLSGKPLKEKSLAMVGRIYKRTEGKLVIIGAGGIMSAQDAIDFLRAGASLVQLYTGFIYGGPAFARDLTAGLISHMDRLCLKSVEQVRQS